jgi:uncharacterized protein
MRLSFLLLILPLPALAAGFDCLKAATKVEKLICRSTSLSQLDDDLSASYRSARKGPVDSEPVSIDQARWLKNVRSKCKDEACLERAYKDRILVLRQWHDDAPAGTRADGNYVFPHEVGTMSTNATGDGFEFVSTEDCLSIKTVAPGEADISVNLEQFNGHSCSISARFAWNGSAYDIKPSPDLGDCRLRVRIKRNTLSVVETSATPGACNSSCGARASFGIRDFLRSDTTSSVCEQ